MNLTDEQKEKLIQEGALALFEYHNGIKPEVYKNKFITDRIIKANRSDVEVIIRLIEKI